MTTPDESAERLTAFGNQLVAVHDWLRDELADLRANLDSSAAAPTLSADLRAHCLTFCQAITRHHTGEDQNAFRRLGEHFPSLQPVLDTLARDHSQVTYMLGTLERLVSAGDRVAILRELDGIEVLLELHFFYEEKKIVTALNSLDLPEWRDSTPAFLLRND